MPLDPFVLLLVLVGPFVGSFLGVLADRLPRGEGVILGHSECRSCQFRLGPRDLIPVLSYAMNRGKCRHCGATIPPWLLYTEIAATGLAVLAALSGDTPVQAWSYAVFLWLLLALIVTDLTTFRLPDLLTGALFFVALWLALLPGGVGPESALIGGLAGAGSFWLLRHMYKRLRKREGMGLGDVKLMAGLGAYAGYEDLPLMVLGAALMGLGASLLMRQPQPNDPAHVPIGQRALPFGAALCLATALLWIWRVSELIG